ncbi:MAG TPA: SGNH/GDSL hydrolase family protein [Marmoricola sp.]|nr:SGNH/GDSL hydrolase family protein [Marmoricola sp.]
MTRAGRRTAAALGILLVLVAAASGCGGKKEALANAEYVALGDSYTSGPGLDPVADNSCRRSEMNYPSRVAAKLKIKSFADRSCGGARLGNLTQPQSFPNQITHVQVEINRPQMDAIGKDTKLVTIGMGLNDQAIATSLLLICVTLKSTEPSPYCQQYLARPQSSIDDQIRTVAGDLAKALASIKKKAPDAKIVLVGYPRIAPDTGSCGSPGQADARFPVPEAMLARLRDTMKLVNELWSETAKQAHVMYVDMYDASEGHDICSADPWINGYLPDAGKGIGLHPRPEYTKVVADKIAELVGNV